MGLRNPNLQTIQIPDSWSINESKRWLQQHGYLWMNYRNTENYHRFVQTYDIKGAEFYSKKLSNGIILVFQRY
jgi:hypothetical protein